MEAHDYEGIGEASNAVLAYDLRMGVFRRPPMAVAPLPSVRRVLDYGVTAIPPEKIYMGMPNYGYDWAPALRAGGNESALDRQC